MDTAEFDTLVELIVWSTPGHKNSTFTVQPKIQNIFYETKLYIRGAAFRYSLCGLIIQKGFLCIGYIREF